jgi:hypothetical protein
MRLLLYVSVNDGVGKRLQKMIEEIVPKNNLEIYRTIENFSRRFRKPVDNLPITAVLLASCSEDLVGFLSIRDLLRDVRIILILPDRDEDTIAQGHTLRPRFLSYTDSDFSDIVAVLEKCFESNAIKR